MTFLLPIPQLSLARFNSSHEIDELIPHSFDRKEEYHSYLFSNRDITHTANIREECGRWFTVLFWSTPAHPVRSWFSGKIIASHAMASGSIPEGRILFTMASPLIEL